MYSEYIRYVVSKCISTCALTHQTALLSMLGGVTKVLRFWHGVAPMPIELGRQDDATLSIIVELKGFVPLPDKKERKINVTDVMSELSRSATRPDAEVVVGGGDVAGMSTGSGAVSSVSAVSEIQASDARTSSGAGASYSSAAAARGGGARAAMTLVQMQSLGLRYMKWAQSDPSIGAAIAGAIGGATRNGVNLIAGGSLEKYDLPLLMVRPGMIVCKNAIKNFPHDIHNELDAMTILAHPTCRIAS